MMDIDLKNLQIALVSLGCDKNLVDSEVMLAQAVACGAELINDCAAADVIVVNTCGFITDASQESVDAVLDAVEHKKGSCKAVIVTGCMAERYKDDIFDELPGVDAVVGANKHGELVRVIRQVIDEKKTVSVYGRDDGCYFGERIVSTKHYAYLKIAEGCDNHCTYCSIPAIRGAYKSRTVESLVAEAQVLADGGCAEIILVAQDVAAYGMDMYGEGKLPELLRELAKVDKIKWLRLLYCYPRHITDELIGEMANNAKVLKYIDMPVQHAAESVLKRMGRGVPDVREIVKKLRAMMPDIAIRTTLITGFPGETEVEFNELVRFVKDVEFDRLGVFAYSREEGTPAYDLPGQLPVKVKEKRKDKIMETQQGISAKKLNERIGARVEVLVEGKTENGTCYGRSHMDAPGIDGVIFLTAENAEEMKIGEHVMVEITGSNEYDTEGKVIIE